MVFVSRISLTVLLTIAVGALADDWIISIPEGNPSALQDYLCNGSLPSNTTLLLQRGIHVISREGSCIVHGELMNVRLTGAGVRETTVMCTRKWGFGFSSAQNVVIDGLAFVACGSVVNMYSNTTAVLYLNSSHFVSIINVSFFNISGFGVYGDTLAAVNMSDVFFGGCVLGTICVGASFISDNSATSITINRCSFVGLGQRGSYKNLYDGVAGLQIQGRVVADIRDCSFDENSGAGLFAINSNVSIFNCSFSANVANQGAAINASSVWFLNVTGSRFYNNRADDMGAAIQVRGKLGSSRSPALVVNDCHFQNNHAETGGGIFMFDLLSTVVLSSLTFVNNSACIGAAIYAGDTHIIYGDNSYSINITDVVVIGNKWRSSCTNGVRGAVVYYNEIDDLYISGSSKTGSQFIGNYPQGAIQGIGANLHLSGMVSFRNNSGENGAAIYLTNDAHLYFHVNCTVDFSYNIATGLGGAIYVEGDQTITTSILSYCAMHFIGQGNYAINFNGNYANIAGNSIYATPIYDCLLDTTPAFYPAKQSDYYTFYTMHDSNGNQILSFPVNLHLCGCRYGNSWAGSNISSIRTFPGATLQCNATFTDYAGSLSPSVVFAQVVTGGSNDSPNVRLAPQQEVQWISTECTALKYEIYGPQNTSVILQLSTKPGRNLRPIGITLQWCEAGFALHKDSIGLLQCECSDFLSSFGVTCDINEGTVSRSGLQWIGLYSDGNEATASTCPLRYCNPNVAHIKLGRPSDICAGGRVGVLCGQCPDGLSVVFGSAECQKCSDVWLLTILLYAIMGALLVAVLFLLNITVTFGSLYGLIFYANILVVNGTIFFSHSYLMPLEIIVSLINLDLGFPLCFYNGMDDLAKTGLQFVFPAYLLLISLTIVVASKYCLNWSSSGTYSCIHRIRRSIGKRAVNVLATLIYLSYSKVLRTVIDIFTYVDVYIHNDNNAVRVWFYDGMINYLSGNHILLFIFAILASVVLFLFTFAITIIPIIVVHSEKNVICKWLNKNMISLPVSDAYYSPYKGKYRIWLGARLWLVVLLYGLGPFLGPQNPSLLLLSHAILVIIFTFIQIRIMPFGEAVLAICGKNKQRSMYLLNLLDLFYLLNYALLALIVSYLLTKDNNTVPLKVVVGSFVGLSIAAFFLIVIFHVIVAIHKAWSRCYVTPLNNSETFHPIKNQESENIALTSSTVVGFDELREPLLDNPSQDLQ